jgi:DNA-binding GntR family transcriptional regulator
MRQVAAALNVSPTPVRDALRRLQADGLVRDRGRLGAEVVGLTARDVIDLFGARAALETYAARMIALRPAAETLIEMRRVLDLWPHALDEDIEENRHHLYALDRQFHWLIVNGAQNARIAQMYEWLSVPLGVVVIFEPRVIDRAEINHREHLAIAHALEQGNPEEMAQAVNAHLTNSRDDILRLMTSHRLI